MGEGLGVKWFFLGMFLLVSCGSKPTPRPFSGGQQFWDRKKEKKEKTAISDESAAVSAGLAEG